MLRNCLKKSGKEIKFFSTSKNQINLLRVEGKSGSGSGRYATYATYAKYAIDSNNVRKALNSQQEKLDFNLNSNFTNKRLFHNSTKNIGLSFSNQGFKFKDDKGGLNGENREKGEKGEQSENNESPIGNPETKPRENITSESLLGNLNRSEKLEENPSKNDKTGEKPLGKSGKKSTYVPTAERRRDRLAKLFYAGLFTSIFVYGLYLSRDWDKDEEQEHKDIPNGASHALTRMRIRFSDFFKYYESPAFDDLLPPPLPAGYQHPYTLVVDLDDFLVHSEWTRDHGWRTAKRPGVDYFLGYLSQYYEIVVFSSSYSAYAANIVSKLDPYRVYITYALFREATRYKDGDLIKDLSLMNRDLGKILIIDTKPEAYSLQPRNGIPGKAWNGNPDDRELIKLVPFLEWLATSGAKDVRPILDTYKDKQHIPEEYARREAIARKNFENDFYEKYGGSPENPKSGNFLLSLFGIKTESATPKMPIDHVREEAQKNYAHILNFIKENGEKILNEEKQKEKEFMAEQQLTLGTMISSIANPSANPLSPENIMAQEAQKQNNA